ncbi:hypothetical protein DIS18_03645 [Algibacter marinivivus]|uniref:Uncharacterized protein n=1 Tax=Algibacter marinivivus TaxID=2100723 RepID=A0A2U2X7D6_9FLAO|nr:hypothetical protein [Algibacter marinivivus]PWH83660.1 hypothetical protein DIS18_03645 [Algibacter marinivivus]
MILGIIYFIIEITIIFIFIKLILNKLNYFKEKKGFKNIISVLSAILIYSFISVLFFNNLTKIPKEKFDEIVWKENITERHKMIDDLLESEYLIGKSKNKINDVFGEPEMVLEDGKIFQYKLVGRSWADFNLIDLKLYFENDIVKKFEYFDSGEQ